MVLQLFLLKSEWNKPYSGRAWHDFRDLIMIIKKLENMIHSYW
jgi:hypothetical protein